jgi:uncharacterized protein (DUF58 family)
LGPREARTNEPDRAESPARASLQELLALRAHTRRESLPGTAKRIASGGQRLSMFRGRGMEFEESRLYQPGDDVRHLDWKVTARSGKPHTKLFREERERPVLFWLDLRPGMFFATRGRFKSVQAIRASALLAWRASAHGDRVGGMVFGQGRHHEQRPGQGHRAVLRWLGTAVDAQAWDAAPAEPPDDLATGLRRLRRMARPGCLVFLISDFRGLDQSCEEELSLLARHCSLVAVSVYDPLERELPPAGRYTVIRGDRTATIDSGDPAVIDRYAERIEKKREQLSILGRRLRMPLIEVSTEDDAIALSQQYLPRFWK